ncbi:hypothetical protein [Bacillus sp. OK048]|uniref:hypothetical protein n=1 Tax=Bacillus sp. OK048 TaxID=1882761 RepID=UPI00088E2E91|nr:hypothetical protein [Bacillus sp. OK048]SDM41737.1 hypothetical protein SAMN05443253_103240 [Bacillus sp. OK048]
MTSEKEINKPISAFLRDFQNIKKLEAIPTGDIARADIAGDPTKHIIYYEDGVLTTETGLGLKTRYVKGFFELRMEGLKEEIKQVVIKSDAPYDLQDKLINEIKKIIDNYVEEKEESNDL